MPYFEAYGPQVGHWQSYMKVIRTDESETVSVVDVEAYFHSIGWGFEVDGCTATATQHDNSGNVMATSGPQVFSANTGYGETKNILGAKTSHRYERKAQDYTIRCYGKVVLAGGYEDGESLAQLAEGQIVIPARPYTPHGNPTVTANGTVVQTGTNVTISWAKSKTQGNADFTRFELYKGKTLVYSGTGTKKQVQVAEGENTYTLYEVHTWFGTEKKTSAKVTIYGLTPQGEPTIKATPQSVTYGQKSTISWAKSTTAGNTTFKKFTLYRNEVEVYDGTNTSFVDTPSNYTGAQGGTVTYRIVEVCDYHGVAVNTDNSVTITVNGGTVTVYDAGGNKHTALAYVYNADGTRHNCLVYAYDANGTRHNCI